ncbi:MAG: hypothetical protein IKE70_02790 [Bacilli bacterium]|nr:hypothetical protein [Bacilli bacterium]
MKRKIKKTKVIIILLLITVIGIGYATLGANLRINGVTKIENASWNVRFKENSIHISPGSIEVDTTNGGKEATIDNISTVSYQVKLLKPGDFYEFTVDVENTGSIDAMIGSISNKINLVEINENSLPDYLKYSVSYSDGVEIKNNQFLKSNTTETIKVRIEYDPLVNVDDLPTSNDSFSFSFELNYVQSDSSAIQVNHN